MFLRPAHGPAPNESDRAFTLSNKNTLSACIQWAQKEERDQRKSGGTRRENNPSVFPKINMALPVKTKYSY